MPENSSLMQKLAGQRIILADEDQMFRTQLTQILRQLGAEIIEAVNGVDVLELLAAHYRRKKYISYLITNVSLPRMDGVAVLRSIRENKTFDSLPVITLARPQDERKLHESRCLGVDAYFPLPLRFEDLIRKLIELVTISRDRNEKTAQESVSTHPALTKLQFPFEFGGFPQPKNYALRPAYYRCPFCETTFTAPRLVNRALKADPQDYMGVGLYTDGMERDYLEYLLIETFICPGCLYAADKSGFFHIWMNGQATLEDAEAVELKDWTPPFFTVNARLQEQLGTTVDDRMKLVRQGSNDGYGLFALAGTDRKIPRLPSDALLVYTLARKCAEQILPAQQRGEEQARLHHKVSGYYVKQYYIHGMLLKEAQDADDAESIARCKQEQGKALLSALAAVNMVNDIEFNVIEECLYCQTRRFFIADLLCGSAATDEQRDKLADLRKRALGAMKATMIRARQEKSDNVKVIERFMLPLENRMLELEKLEKEKENPAVPK